MKINKDLTFENIDGQIVVLDNSNKFFGETKALLLNETATFIFECLQKGENYSQICNSYLKKYNLTEEETKVDVDTCISNLLKKGIINNDK